MTAIEKTEGAKVPDLYRPPTLDITADHIALPKLKLGQYTADAVKGQLVKPGCIFTTTGQDDGDPVMLWDPKKKGDNPGVRVHVLDMFLGRSLAVNGELQRWSFDDPEAPKESWVTYNYTVALPEVDTEVPARWLLTRSGKNAAQQMNLILKREEGRTPCYAIAFEVTTAERGNAKGEWFVPIIKRVKQEEVSKDHIAIAENLAQMVHSSDFEDRYVSEDEEPEI